MEPEKGRRKQRRTEAVVLGAALSALIMTACGEERDPRRCIDPRTGKVVESYYCDDDETRRRYGGSGYGMSHVWYWGGSGFSRGDTVAGGSSIPPRGYAARGTLFRSGSSTRPGTTHVSAMSRGAPSGVARGGFGSSASSHGGGS